MNGVETFRLLTVGMPPLLVQDLWDRVGAQLDFPLLHLVHPSYDKRSWGGSARRTDQYFFREDIRVPMPPPDRELLASVEREGVPTLHNMIMSDRILSKLRYEDALSYATFLTRRLIEVYEETRPSVVIGAFDALHGSLSLAVARYLGIPWFAMYFAAIPTGNVALCSDLTPASITTLEPGRSRQQETTADRLLREFEQRTVQAAAYVPPQLLSTGLMMRQIPAQMKALREVLRRRPLKSCLKYTDHANSYSISAQFAEAFRLRSNLWQLRRQRLRQQRGAGRYAFFGLHMQPESSIDVFAHFFANQPRVLELMARSLPPTHRLLIKLHKSDTLNYSNRYLAALARYPGVELVSPWADTYDLIKHADLVFSIQGTIGLEAAMLGKPVIMFGDSPLKGFPSVATFGRTVDLPRLVREQLAQLPPERSEIVRALAAFLAAFYPASANDWTVRPSDPQIAGYARLFQLLARHVRRGVAAHANQELTQ